MRGQSPNWLLVQLVDEAYFDLPVTVAGFCHLIAGGLLSHWAQFMYGTSGKVQLIANSSSVVDTNTDLKFCIYDNGSNVRIHNRTGNTYNVRMLLGYTP